MTGKECGRCEDEFRVYGEEYPAFLNALSPIGVDQYGVEGAAGEPGTPGGWLCPDCRTAFLAFMEGDR